MGGTLHGKFDAANGDTIEALEINDTGGVDSYVFEVQVATVPVFRVRSKDASIGDKPIINNFALVTFNNPDSDTVALVKDGGSITFGTSGGATLTRDGVASIVQGHIVGNNILYAYADAFHADQIHANPNCISPITGKIPEVKFFIEAAAGNLRAAIYAGDGTDGIPGTLLGQSASIAATAGWMNIPLTLNAAGAAGDTLVTAGQSIWIAIACDDDGLTSRLGLDGSGMGLTIGHAYGAFPDPFPGPGSPLGNGRSIVARVIP